jgi:tetratricopeptide (TPR) repeat protein
LGDYADARSKYIRIHELRPDIGVVATFIGQTYAQEGNPTAAEQWYQEAIDANFHDFMAHWLLAENLYARKQYAIAAAEIAVAWVLNRNARDIRIAVAKIFLADKRKWIDFEFVPNYRIQKTGDQVLVRFSEEWMMYALCKALWEYEPGYHRELGGGRNAFDMTQEKECLLNLAIGYDRMQKGKSTKHQEIETLVRAIQAKRSNEFIFMEQWLRLEPLIAYTQPKEAILALANYVLDIRAPRK